MDDETGYGSNSGTGDGGGQQQGTEGNPAWTEFLSVVPQELHPQVTPILEKWDRGVQERFQKVHSEYEPWKPILGAGVSPDDAQFALNLLNSLNTSPQLVYDAIGEYYKLGGKNGSSGQGQVEPIDKGQDDNDPYAVKLAAIEQQNQIMAKYLVSQREAELQAAQDAKLERELAELRKQHGDYDEDYVLAKLHQGKTGEQAVKDYQQLVARATNARTPRPLIMGSGGNIPGPGVDPKKLDDKGVKDLVVQMLAAHKDQSQ